MRKDRSLVTSMLDGALAGAAATWVMGKVTTYLYAHEEKSAREREDRARQGTTSYGVAAEKVAKAVGTELSSQERQTYGRDIHWALGVGAGAAYGALMHRFPAARTANGLAFGAAFWLLMDEAAVTLLGLTPGPTAFPWQTHARGLAAHLVFGAVANSTLSALEPAA